MTNKKNLTSIVSRQPSTLDVFSKVILKGMAEFLVNGRTCLGRVRLILLSLMLLVLACGSGGPVKQDQSSSPRRGGTFRVVVPGAESLDPLYLKDVYETAIVGNLFNGLVRLDDNLEVRPDLATEWTVSPDGREYLFKIAPGVRFHDGSPLSMEDILFTFQRCLVAKRQPSQVLEELVATETRSGAAAPRIDAPDNGHIRIVLKHPYPEFFRLLAIDSFRIIPRKYFPISEQKTTPPFIGTGPFILEKYDQSGAVLRRNENYFRRPAWLERIEFAFDEKAYRSSQLELFQQGAIHIADGFFKPEIEKSVPPDHCISKPQLMSVFLIFNCRKHPTDNPFFRKALIAAMDREEYAQTLPSTNRLANTFLPPGMFGFTPFPEAYPYSMLKAVNMLNRSGINRSQLPTLSVLCFSPTDGFSKMVEKACSAIKMKVKVEHVSWRVFNQKLEAGDYNIVRLPMGADNPIPEQFFHDMLFSRSEQNLSGFSDPEMDSLIMRLYSMNNLNEKLAAIRAIEAKIQDEAPLMPLSSYIMHCLVNPQVQNFKVSPLGLTYINLEDVWLKSPSGE